MDRTDKLARGLSLRAYDAVHLATALSLREEASKLARRRQKSWNASLILTAPAGAAPRPNEFEHHYNENTQPFDQ